MFIRIRRSRRMDETSTWVNGFESRNIRLPASLRAYYALGIGEFVRMARKDGGFMTLYVTEAHSADLNVAADYASVTTNNYEQLLVTDEQAVELHRISGITLGCDPELFLVNRYTGAPVSAYRLFKKHGEVGNDGMLLELRPQPSVDEKELTNTIGTLIRRARAELNKFPEGPTTMLLGASHYGGLTAGFHLHFGLPRGLLGHNNKVRAAASIITTAMDYFVGIPSIIPEGSHDAIRRTRPGIAYGKPGGMRLDSRTFEYRLPGGILLQHPIFTRGILALGAVVVEDIASRVSTLTDAYSALSTMTGHQDMMILYPRLPGVGEIYHTICSTDISPARRFLSPIVEDVRSMGGYERRADSIEPFFKCLYEGTIFNKDIESNWEGAGNAHRQGPLEFLQASE